MLLSSFFQKIVIFTSKSLKRELSKIPDMETAPSSGGGAEAGTAIDSSLSAAGGLVDRHILVNDDYLDLAGLLGVASHLAPAVSGLQVVYQLSRITSLFLSPVFFLSLTLSLSLLLTCQDRDYPSSDAAVGEMSAVKRVPLPPELVDQFSTMQCNCAMGLFTRVSRAWLTIDSDIFVWNYEDGSDVAFYDQVCLRYTSPNMFELRSYRCAFETLRVLR